QTVTPSPGSRSECLLTGLRQRPRSANPSQRYESRSASKTTAGTPGPGSYDPEPVSFDMYMPQHTRQEKRARMEPYKDLYKSVTKAESRGSSRQSLETCSTQSIFWPSGTLD
ncbi:LZTR1, partial [Symbiodinium microadriaticum]